MARSLYASFLSALLPPATAYAQAKSYHCPAFQFDDFVRSAYSGSNFRSQTLTVPSTLPDARRMPSAPNATARTTPRWPRRRRTSSPLGTDLGPHGAVRARRGELAAVGAEGHAEDFAVVAGAGL